MKKSELKQLIKEEIRSASELNNREKLISSIEGYIGSSYFKDMPWSEIPTKCIKAIENLVQLLKKNKIY